jgi:acyl dehydratase
MIDARFKGYATAPTKVHVDRWRVRLFCQAIGEDDPVFLDPEAARRAGHRDCPAPPTFLKALESEHCGSAELLKLLGVPVARVLHAEQSFDLHHPVYAGDDVEIHRVISDFYDKRDGAMTFIVIRTTYCVSQQEAGHSVQTILVRNPKATA